MMRKSRWFWGTFVLVGAVLLLGSQFGWFDYPYTFWSMLLTIVFAAILITSLVGLSLTGITFSVAALCIIYAQPLNLSPWFIPLNALLVDIGLSLLFGPVINRVRNRKFSYVKIGPFKKSLHYHDHGTDDKREKISFSSKFSSNTKYLHNKNLKQVSFEATLGELKVYFDDVVPAGPDINVYLHSTMSEVELYMPEEWNVIDEIDYFASDINIPERSDLSTTTVHLRGDVKMSEVVVKSI